MVLQISQETFDEAVRENMEEFDMPLEEAITEAVQQFEKQGVDLSLIITDMAVKPDDANIVVNAIKALYNINSKKGQKIPAEYLEQLKIIKTECNKGLQYRIVAGKEGAYPQLLDTLLANKNNLEILLETLKTFTALMTQQPDLLEDKGVQTMIDLLDQQKDPEVQRWVLKWAKECCTLHEMNRQKIFDAGILDHLKPHLEEATSQVLRDVLAVLRALVLDDDIRVEFGKAHEHARAIASDTLCAITALLGKFKTDEPLMNDVMLTLSSLLVRDEFCKKVEDAGGLDLILDTMKTFLHNDKLVRQCFKLLKVLAGNDVCKSHIIEKGGAPIITNALNKHKESPQTVVVGLSCVAALSLRSPSNSKALFNAGIPDAIIAGMKQHLDNENVQKNGSWAIRNMVSRSRDQNAKFLSLGAEELLKADLKKFKKFEYDVKSALRDLGCDVELKEAWTGKGGRITTQGKK